MGEVWLAFASMVSGYVLAVFTWPHVRLRLQGTLTEIDDLRARAMKLEAKLRRTVPTAQRDKGKGK
jgi:hypothetical protein